MNISADDIHKINKLTRKNIRPDSIYAFSMVLCDNDIDEDYEKFSVEALYQLKDKFLGKTGVCNHEVKSAEQQARIFDTWIERTDRTKTQDGEDFCQLKVKAYLVKTNENISLIKEIEASVAKEITVSCSMGKNICSICGNDKRMSHCEHINGKKYNGKLAYSILSDVDDAYEFSFVTIPISIVNWFD